MGITGVEGMYSFLGDLDYADKRTGVFRVAAEISMQLLRDNRDTLMSVLDAFVHDPLVEWENGRGRRVGKFFALQRHS